MDWKEIERLRVNGFALARRGYDRREVDNFLASLVDWIETDAAKDLGDEAVRRKLELVGKSTSHILLTTENESQELRRRTEEECAQLRAKTEAASHEVRRAANEYAKQVRDKADHDARRTADAASARAKGIVEDAERRRSQIEGVIATLEAGRDDTLSELERLGDELASTIGTHRPAQRVHADGGGRPGEHAQKNKGAGAAVKPR